MERDEFLHALWRGAPWAYYWRIKPDGNKETLWFPAQTPPPVPATWARSNVYMGVNTTAVKGPAHRRALKQADPTKPDAPPVAQVGCLFCEWDAKDFDDRKEAILAHLEALWAQGQGLPWPSVLVDSGGGYHGYWLLDEPLHIDHVNRAEVVAAQAAWVDLWRADDNAKDIARVLRLPGTLNHKYEPPPPVAFHPDSTTGRTYCWAWLLEWLPELEPAQPHESAQVEVSANDGKRAAAYGAAAVRRELENVANAPVGKRNHTVNRSAFRLGRLVGGGVMGEDGLVDALTRAGVQAGLPEAEARKEAGNGLAAGRRAPRTLPESAQAQVNSAAHINGNGAHPRPQIQVNNRQLSDVAADALRAVELRNAAHPRTPILCTRGGQLVRVLQQEAAIQSASKDALKALLATVAAWTTRTTKEKTGEVVERDTFPPQAVIDVLSGGGEWPTLPRLEGIVTTPVLTAGGLWVTEPGYDATSGLYLVPGGPCLGDTEPTAERVAWAKTLILTELLGDFPFVDRASRAHAVALLLVGFVRHAINGATPLHLVDAPTPGTGKGLLVTACCLPAAGGEVSSMHAGRDDDEWRKRLTAVLSEGATHVNLDNLTGTLDSAAFAAALTQSNWGDRVLGSSTTVRVKVRAVWTATANNVRLSDEIRRRCTWIRIDANAERPEERTGFRHDDLIGWARANRAALATAAVVLVRNWQAQDARPGAAVKGSFQEWARMMGGILEAAGIPGFLGNESALYEAAATDAQAIRAFVAAWAEKHGRDKVTVAELMPLACTSDESDSESAGLLDALLGGGNARARAIRLGQLLGAHSDRVFTVEDDGSRALWKISKCGKAKGVKQWQLAPAQHSPASQTQGV